ncbi:MAG: hypothetical protein KTR20_01500 [Cellvibrionaceae bacterium]|nr:hypothetical protein [Cellvibrionaceae bacterium]
MQNPRQPLLYCLLLLSLSITCKAANSAHSLTDTSTAGKAFSLELALQTWEADASWNTASDINGITTPNVLSELDYKTVRLTPLSLTGEWRTVVYGESLVLGVNLIGGDIRSGTVRDSDYAADNRNDEWSRSHSDISGDSVNQYRTHIGWLFEGEMDLGLLAGYQHSEQTLRMQKGVQLLCVAPCSGGLGSFSGLNSVYQMVWQGPWLGLSLSERRGAHRLLVDYEYHFATRYRGEAQWNLRTDLQQPRSFVHEADAGGQQIRLSYHYYFSPHWQLTALYQHTRWRTDAGLETRYFANNTTGTIRLNRAHWQSQAYGLGLRLRF